MTKSETMTEQIVRFFSEKHEQRIGSSVLCGIHTAAFIGRSLSAKPASVASRLNELRARGVVYRFPKEIVCGELGGWMYAATGDSAIKWRID